MRTEPAFRRHPCTADPPRPTLVTDVLIDSMWQAVYAAETFIRGITLLTWGIIVIGGVLLWFLISRPR